VLLLLQIKAPFSFFSAFALDWGKTWVEFERKTGHHASGLGWLAALSVL
jgi:hypothetical protein